MSKIEIHLLLLLRICTCILCVGGRPSTGSHHCHCCTSTAQARKAAVGKGQRAPSLLCGHSWCEDTRTEMTTNMLQANLTQLIAELFLFFTSSPQSPPPPPAPQPVYSLFSSSVSPLVWTCLSETLHICMPYKICSKTFKHNTKFRRNKFLMKKFPKIKENQYEDTIELLGVLLRIALSAHYRWAASATLWHRWQSWLGGNVMGIEMQHTARC